MASCSAIKMSNAINGFGGLSIPQRLAGHWSTVGGEWIEPLNGGCLCVAFFLFLFHLFIKLSIFIDFLAFACSAFSRMGSKWLGEVNSPHLPWSLWRNKIQMKTMNKNFEGKEVNKGEKNPFSCSEIRDHYEINIWCLFQTSGHMRTTRSQLRFRGWKGCVTAALLHSEGGLGYLLVDLARLFPLLTALSLRDYNNILCKSW